MYVYDDQICNFHFKTECERAHELKNEGDKERSLPIRRRPTSQTPSTTWCRRSSWSPAGLWLCLHCRATQKSRAAASVYEVKHVCAGQWTGISAPHI